MYTAHGHYIPGSTPMRGPAPTDISDCGGVNVCPRCKYDIRIWTENGSSPFEAQPQKVDHVDYALKAKQTLIRYVDMTTISLDEKATFEVYTVMFSKTLNTWRALMITDMPDNIMYEIVGEGKTIHVNEYMKVRNAVFED